MAYALFLNGPLRGSGMPLENTRTVRIGRDPECEISLDDVKTSRFHARIYWRDGNLLVEDTGSTNGIFVNSKPVPEEFLRDGDLITVGSTVIKIVMHADDSSVRLRVNPDIRPSSDVSAKRASVRGRTTLPLCDSHDQYQALFDWMMSVHKIIAVENKEIIEKCLREIFNILPASRLSVYMLGFNGKMNHDFTTTKKGSPANPIDQSYAEEIQKAGKTMVVKLGATNGANAFINSILGVPLREGSRIIAVLLCDNLEEPMIFTERMEQTLEMVGTSMELAFQRDSRRRHEYKQIQNETNQQLASKVQNYIFTRKRPSAMAGLDWGVYFQSAPEVAGDFYDFHQNERGVTWIVSDISGKGIGAALLVSMLKGMCLSLYQQQLGPLDFIRRLNELLINEMPRGMFLTSLVAHIAGDGMLTYCNASHNPGMVLHGHGQVTALRPSGSPLGVMGCNEMSRKLEENVFQLTKNDKVLLYTDGLVDVTNANRDFYGETRMVDSFKRGGNLDVGEHLNQMVYDLKQFQGSTDLPDDVTMVLGKVV